MGRVYATFTVDTFGVSPHATDKSRKADQFMRALHRTVAHERRQLKPARVAVRRALAVLRRADRTARECG